MRKFLLSSTAAAGLTKVMSFGSNKLLEVVELVLSSHLPFEKRLSRANINKKASWFMCLVLGDPEL